jgi:endonuclease/exonuclease/phosphatase family metal-dependent hydrolase
MGGGPIVDSKDKRTSGERLRVATVNLLSPEHADWPRRRTVLGSELRRLGPDIIALQEIIWGDAADIVELLGEEYYLIPHSARSSDGVGAVLASRWPLRHTAELDLHGTGRVTLPWCAAVAAEVDVPPPFGPTLFVHHKPTYEVNAAHERELQSVACAMFVEELLAGRDLHVILLGDLDDTPDSSSIRFWTGRQALGGVSVAYRDVWEVINPSDQGHTFARDNPLVRAGEMALELGRRIDYIMIRCGIHGPSLDVTDCFRPFAEPIDGVWASDHSGVVADLEVPDHAPGTWALSPGRAGDRPVPRERTG